MKISKPTQILFIALLVVIVFSPSLKNDFAWDDRFLIVDNPYVKTWDNIPTIFSSPHNNLGNIYSMFGYFDMAIEEYKAALSVEPANKDMWDNLIKTKAEWKAILLKSSGDAS